MIRVTNLERSVAFYTEILGMKLLRTSENTKYQYSLAFLGYDAAAESAELELTYNWDVNQYEHGTAFGHIAIGIDDLYSFCEKIKANGVKLTREAGPVKGGLTIIAFLEDPDGYKIELIENNQSKQGLN